MRAARANGTSMPNWPLVVEEKRHGAKRAQAPVRPHGLLAVAGHVALAGRSARQKGAVTLGLRDGSAAPRGAGVPWGTWGMRRGMPGTLPRGSLRGGAAAHALSLSASASLALGVAGFPRGPGAFTQPAHAVLSHIAAQLLFGRVEQVHYQQGIQRAERPVFMKRGDASAQL